jgi:pyruvate/2-oxoglutarate dehydrogenase complex dihydrolipoamide dehydrogenase (E3) component
MDYPGPTRARELGETRRLLKVVVDADTELILGAAILNVEGGEIAAVLQVAMLGGLPTQRFETRSSATRRSANL